MIQIIIHITLVLTSALLLNAGTQCGDPELILEFRSLKNRVEGAEAAESLVRSIHLMDSLEREGMNNCLIYYKFALVKAEALEILSRFDEALEFYYTLLEKANNLGYAEIVAESYICIARIHEVIDRPADSKRNLLLAKSIIEKNELDSLSSQFARRYSSYHRIYENKDSALYYARMAIRIGEKFGTARSVVDGNLLIGIVSESIDSSLYYFRKARDMFLDRKSYIGAATQSLNITKRLLDANRLVEAKEELERVFNYAMRQKELNKGFYSTMSRAYDIKKEMFLKENRLDSALYYTELSHDFDIKSIEKEDQGRINEIEIRNAIQQEKNKIKALTREKSLLGLILTGGSILFASIIILLFINIKSKQTLRRKNRTITKKNDTLKDSLDQNKILLSEIHHRVKNNLQMVISILTLQAAKSNNKVLKTQLKNISEKVYSIALIHEQLYKEGNFDEIDLKNYFQRLAEHFRNISDIPENINIKIDVENLHLNIETTIPMGMIFSELLSNTIKYGRTDDGRLDIQFSLKKEAQFFMFRFKDKGKGYPHGELRSNSDSMGALLISSMADQLRASSSTYNDNGSVFEMRFVEKKVSVL